MTNITPTVSVITPVYNGERYLEECIKSVLSQTYSDWEYLIYDNCSTDRSGEIARGFASRDPRIRVERSPRFLDIWTNHNSALREINSTSRYIKFVHADDFLYPECLERMVALADANPSVNIVSSYRLEGRIMQNDRVFPYCRTIMSGREVAEYALRDSRYITGSPTAILLRADLVRARPDFYDASLWGSDTDADFREMMTSDVGFVHQLLTFTRMHDGALTTFSLRVHSHLSNHGRWILRYGPASLGPDSYRKTIRRWLKDYGLFLAKQTLKPARHRQREFHDFHRNEIETLMGDAECDPESRAILSFFTRFLHSPSNNDDRATRPANAGEVVPMEA